jgi:hypothetical protein
MQAQSSTMNVMTSLSLCPMAHPPRSNPPRQHQGTIGDELGTFPIARPVLRIDTVAMPKTITDRAITGGAADVQP